MNLLGRVGAAMWQIGGPITPLIWIGMIFFFPPIARGGAMNSGAVILTLYVLAAFIAALAILILLRLTERPLRAWRWIFGLATVPTLAIALNNLATDIAAARRAWLRENGADIASAFARQPTREPASIEIDGRLVLVDYGARRHSDLIVVRHYNWECHYDPASGAYACMRDIDVKYDQSPLRPRYEPDRPRSLVTPPNGGSSG